MSEQRNNKKMRSENNKNKNNNNNHSSNEGSGNSSITTNSSGKRGKNKISGSSSSNNNNNSDKPKQPQRGLGVAQLEKIRMHTQMASVGIFPPPLPPPYINPPPFQHVPDEMRYQVGYQVGAPPQPPPPYYCSSPPVSSSHYGYHHPNAFMMNMGDQMERTANIRYSESQSFNTPRWNPNYHAMPETQPYVEQPITRHFLSHVEQQNGMSNELERPKSPDYPHFDSSELQELDLELRL